MKVKKLVYKMNQACLTGDTKTEKKLWFKLLQKSLTGKKTHIVH